MSDSDIFSLDEISRYLKIPKSTLYKLSQLGKLPSFKIGRQLRFKKESIDGWLKTEERNRRKRKKKQRK